MNTQTKIAVIYTVMAILAIAVIILAVMAFFSNDKHATFLTFNVLVLGTLVVAAPLVLIHGIGE